MYVYFYVKTGLYHHFSNFAATHPRGFQQSHINYDFSLSFVFRILQYSIVRLTNLFLPIDWQ